MIVLQILGGLFLLLLFLLCMPLRLCFSYEKETLSLTLRCLFLRIRLLPAPAKPAKSKKKAGRKEKDAGKPPEKKRDPEEILDIALDLLRSAGGAWDILRRHIVFDRVRLYFLVCGGDAHKTALAYARFSNVIFSLMALISSIFALRDRTVFLYPDFTGIKSRYDLSFRISVRPVFAAAAAVNLFRRFLRRRARRQPAKTKGGMKHEPTTSRQ